MNGSNHTCTELYLNELSDENSLLLYCPIICTTLMNTILMYSHNLSPYNLPPYPKETLAKKKVFKETWKQKLKSSIYIPHK